MRTQRVAVAIVQDAQGRFLLCWNIHWNGYTFPMKRIAPAADYGRTAIEALEFDLFSAFPAATAEDLEYLGRAGQSRSARETTWYDYHLSQVDPGAAFDPAMAPCPPGHPAVFEPYDAILARSDVTWSTKAIAEELVESQDAVLVVISRRSRAAMERLVVHNANYGGFFFPAARVKNRESHADIAAGVLRTDLGYAGDASITRVGEVEDVHFSQRFGRDRRYRFHICRGDLSNIDLHQPGNALEQALRDRHKTWQWVTGDQIARRAIHFSPTMDAVRNQVEAAVPAGPYAPPGRVSEGGIALIERSVPERAWLAQWNENWKAYFFVGGHRHADETFHECVVREVQEELGLAPGEFAVEPSPAHRLAYEAISRSSGTLTAYRMELFRTTLTPPGLASIGAEAPTHSAPSPSRGGSEAAGIDEPTEPAPPPLNRWITEPEVRRLQTSDGHPVSPTMFTLLSLAGIISAD